VAFVLTAVKPSATESLTVYPTGVARPPTLSLSTTANVAIGTTVVSAVSASGQITIYNSTGSTDLYGDIVGYWKSPSGTGGGSAYTSVPASRVLSTSTQLGTAASLNVTVTGAGGVPSSGVSAVWLSLTAVAPTATTTITQYPAGSTKPNTVTVSATTNISRTNLVAAVPDSNGQIALYNSAGKTNLYVDVVGYMATAGVPAAPAAPTAVAGDKTVDVSWSAPNDNGAAIASYTVSASPGPATATVDGSATTATVAGLTNGTAYTFTVTATNAAGISSSSAASSPVIPAALPGAPRSVTAVAGDGQASVSWTPPASDGGSPITAYTVTSSPGGKTATTGGTTTATVSGLTNGSAYTFTVVATNARGDGPASAESNSITASDAPDAPTAVTAVPGDAQVTVSWTAPASDGGSPIIGYTVTSSPGGKTATSNGATTVIVSGLTNGTDYTFTVVATTARGNGPASMESEAVTPARSPDAPTSAAAAAGDGAASVIWTAPASDGGSSIIGYTVTANPGGQTATTNGTTTATVTGLTNGTAYTFTVVATNAVGDSQPSLPSDAVTPAATPGRPTAVAATADDGEANVTWTAPASDGGYPITGYTVTVSPGNATVDTTGATQATVTELTNGTAYTFTVFATNALGAGQASSPSSPVTPNGAPGAPTAVIATGGDAQAILTWAPPANDGGRPITGYTVTVLPGGATISTAVPTATVTDLANGSSYTFTVTATNSIGTGPASTPTSPIIPARIPDAPTNASAVPGDTLATVAWTAPASDGGSPVTSYIVTATPGGASVTATGATSATVTGLANGTAYTFTVRATNAAGTGPASDASSAVTPRPAPPGAIDLSVDSATFPLGGHSTLTATTDRDVAPSGQTISLVDQTTNTVLTVCSSGTHCTATVSFQSGPAHNYVAKTGSLTSNPVTVSRAPWTVSLAIDKTVFQAGQTLTLTATANQDVGNTGTHYGIFIMDTTTGVQLNYCVTGPTCSTTTTFTNGGPHSYSAKVTSLIPQCCPSYSQGTDLQATSETVSATRAAWTVSLAQDKTVFQAGESVTLTATANQDVGNTGGKYGIFIFDTTTGMQLKSCLTGATCSTSTTFYTGGPHTYSAQVTSLVQQCCPSWLPGSDVQATSSESISVSRAPWSVSLSQDKTVFAAGEQVTLTATANQDVGDTASKYGIFITDTTTGMVLKFCVTGLTCSTSTTFYTGGPHTYSAKVTSLVAQCCPSYSPGTDVQATSTESVSAAREPWLVSLTQDRKVFAAGQSVTLTVTANQDVGNTASNYGIFITDTTTGVVLKFCVSGVTCSTSASFYNGGPHTYSARVTSLVSQCCPSYSPGTDIQATSVELSASRETWTVSLTQDKTVFAAGDHVTLTATANQNVGNTGNSYWIFITDLTTGQVVTYCDTGKTCVGTSSFYSGGPHTYVAKVTSHTQLCCPQFLPGSDVQATSIHLDAARKAWTVTLDQDKTEFAAGDHVTLTATANQDVSYTGGIYSLFIMDATSGSVVAYCVAGTTCTGSAVFYTGGTHTYVAKVSSATSTCCPTYSPGPDVQAVSHQVRAHRQPWTVTASWSDQSPSMGESVTVLGHANQDVGNTNGWYNMTLRDIATGALIGTCYGAPCTFTFNMDETTIDKYEVFLGQDGWTASGPPDMQANSNGYSAVTDSPGYSLDLAADTDEVSDGDVITVTATTNQDIALGGSQALALYIFNQTNGAQVTACTTGTTCQTTDTYNGGPPPTYLAYIATSRPGPITVDQVQGVVASSEMVPIASDDAYADGATTFGPSVSLDINQWHYNGDSTTGSFGDMNLDIRADVTGIGDGAGCAVGCILKFEGGMPDTDNVIRPTSSIAAEGDTQVVPGMSDATITTSGDHILVADQLYLRAALYVDDGTTTGVLLADSPWQVASSYAVQSSSDVAAVAGTLGALEATTQVTGTEADEVCLEAFPVGTDANGSSLNDEQVACLEALYAAPSATPGRAVASVAARNTWLEIVVTAVLAYLGITDAQHTSPPKTADVDDPYLLERVNTFLQRKSVIYGKQYASLTDSERRTAAEAVLSQCDQMGLEPSDCDRLAIFAPGSDVAQAAAHDFQAITTRGQPAQLNYAPSHGDWGYVGLPNCDVPYDGTQKHCDEYPYNASVQGGPGHVPPVSLEVINKSDNKREGFQYQGFLNACNLKAGSPPFLVIPVVIDKDATSGIPSTGWCGH
jgi:hypothetical protein